MAELILTSLSGAPTLLLNIIAHEVFAKLLLLNTSEWRVLGAKLQDIILRNEINRASRGSEWCSSTLRCSKPDCTQTAIPQDRSI
ncbi:hypothetical protein CHS0354_001722 [Potamilus streckersoni]|uniref:Uncharacterized protein n=1 Tax=Potamilus streckersoni TaxID=2493646 RepID=A0AAE0VPH3_9BIVA|nr:hypothetical protein CHS0354_001722 [Potamilus streckersoni]